MKNRRKQKHHRFSSYLNKVSFKNNILIIKGRRILTSALIFTFLLAGLYCFFTISFPFIIKISLGFGLLILIYAFCDVFFSENSLKWDVSSDFVRIKRSSLKLKTTYQGSSVDKFKLSLKKEQDSETRSYSYNVLLTFKNNKFTSKYLLETFSMSKEKAQAQAQDWSTKLKLPVTFEDDLKAIKEQRNNS